MAAAIVKIVAFLAFYAKVCFSTKWDSSLSAADRISQLPGQPQVSFNHFSGYVSVDGKEERALFYYFVEAEVDPASKPLVLWLNGGIISLSLSLNCLSLFKNGVEYAGPGCSSLGVGAFSENGPFRPSGNGLRRNEHSWNKGVCFFFNLLKISF